MARASKKKPDLLLAAMRTIGEQGWDNFKLPGFAVEQGVDLADLYQEIPSKTAILRQLGKRLDRAMLMVETGDLAELSVRERLFELMMSRFDAMRPFKSGLSEIARNGRRDCSVLAVTFCNLDRMAHRMLDVAGVAFSGLRARLARRLLMASYLRIFRTWLKDESDDQAETLASLDRELARLEQFARFAGRSRPSTDAGAQQSA